MSERTNEHQHLAEPLVAAVLDVDADRCANQIVHLSVLTLLIDAGMISKERAIDRLTSLASQLAHEHLRDEIGGRIDRLVELLGGGRPARPHRWQPKVIDGGLD